MAKDKTQYTCSECGGTSPKWLGKCPSCNAWNTLVEGVVDSGGPAKNRYAGMAALAPAAEVATLSDIEAAEVPRLMKRRKDIQDKAIEAKAAADAIKAQIDALPVLPAGAASPTLEAVKKRGELVCGVNGILPGFSAPSVVCQSDLPSHAKASSAFFPSTGAVT